MHAVLSNRRMLLSGSADQSRVHRTTNCSAPMTEFVNPDCAREPGSAMRHCSWYSWINRSSSASVDTEAQDTVIASSVMTVGNGAH